MEGTSPRFRFIETGLADWTIVVDNNLWSVREGNVSNNLFNISSVGNAILTQGGLTAAGNITAPRIIATGSGPQFQINGTSSGTGNVGYMAFFESNGTTRQGYVGFPSVNNSNLVLRNDVVPSTLELQGTGGANSLKFDYGSGAQTVWHSGNDGAGSGLDADLLDGVQGIEYVQRTRNINTGLHLSGGGNLSADRSLSVRPTVNQYFLDSQGNPRLYFGDDNTTADGLVLRASGLNQELTWRDPSNNIRWRVDTSGNSIQSGTATATNFIGNWNGLSDGQFLRSDANDIKTVGYTRYNDQLEVQFGTGNDARLQHDGGQMNLDLTTGGFHIRVGAALERWRLEQNGNTVQFGTATAASFKTTNWEIVETGGVLQFKYGGTVKFEMNSSGIMEADTNFKLGL